MHGQPIPRCLRISCFLWSQEGHVSVFCSRLIHERLSPVYDPPNKIINLHENLSLWKQEAPSLGPWYYYKHHTIVLCWHCFFPRGIFTFHFYRPLPRPWGIHACVKSASILTIVGKDCCHLSTETSLLTPSYLVSVEMAKGIWGNLSKSVVLNGGAGGSDFAPQGTFGNVQRPFLVVTTVYIS